ncbi:hypothetical protein D9M70_405550 [compost metagenome]
MRHVVGHAGAGFGDRGFLRRHHQVIQLALRGRKASRHREGAGDVRSVAVELAAGVDQAQVAILQLGRAGAVVQHAGIGAGGDDRVVGHALRAVAAELIEQLGFEVVFAQARARGLHRAHMGPGGDFARAAHDGQFARVLEQPHLVKHRADIDRHRRRGHAGTALHAHGVEPAAHLHVGAGRLGQRVSDLRAVGQQRRQRRVDLFDRMRLVEAERGARPFGAVAETVPDLALLVLGAAEQDAAVGIGGVARRAGAAAHGRGGRGRRRGGRCRVRT